MKANIARLTIALRNRRDWVDELKKAVQPAAPILSVLLLPLSPPPFIVPDGETGATHPVEGETASGDRDDF